MIGAPSGHGGAKISFLRGYTLGWLGLDEGVRDQAWVMTRVVVLGAIVFAEKGEDVTKKHLPN